MVNIKDNGDVEAAPITKLILKDASVEEKEPPFKVASLNGAIIKSSLSDEERLSILGKIQGSAIYQLYKEQNIDWSFSDTELSRLHALIHEFNIKDASFVMSFGDEPAQKVQAITNAMMNFALEGKGEEICLIYESIIKEIKSMDLSFLEKNNEFSFKRLFKKDADLKIEAHQIFKNVVELVNFKSDQLKDRMSSVKNELYSMKTISGENLKLIKILALHILAAQIIIQDYEEKNDLNNTSVFDSEKMDLERIKNRLLTLKQMHQMALYDIPKLNMKLATLDQLIAKVYQVIYVAIPQWQKTSVMAFDQALKNSQANLSLLSAKMDESKRYLLESIK